MCSPSRLRRRRCAYIPIAQSANIESTPTIIPIIKGSRTRTTVLVGAVLLGYGATLTTLSLAVVKSDTRSGDCSVGVVLFEPVSAASEEGSEDVT